MKRNEAEALLKQLECRLREKDGKGLPASQRAVLYACLCCDNPSYRKMPDALLNEGYGHYNWNTLKTDGYTVFKRLSHVFKEEIKKKNCSRELVDWYTTYRPEVETLSSPPKPIHSPTPSVHPSSPRDLLTFPSWQSVLAELPQAIRQGHRVVSITGAAGIGKTYFTHALLERIRGDFEDVVWCQASDISSVNRLYHHIQAHLAALAPSNTGAIQPQCQPLPAEGEEATPALMALLRKRRLLVVVDQAEELYRPHGAAGEFCVPSASYETWLSRLLKNSFGGNCLIWVSREPPACFNAQYGVLKTIQLTGLPDADAKQFLETRNLMGPSQVGLRSGPSPHASFRLTSDPQWATFVAFCGGNPAWLFQEATMMRRSHTQDILKFVARPSLESGLKSTLSQILANLPPVESLLLSWLLLKPLSYPEICALDSPNIAPSAWELALASLHEYRSLVTLNEDQHYCIHPPLLRHVLAEAIVHKVTHALWEKPSHSSLALLCASPLFHGRASAEQQQWLWDNVIHAVARSFKQGSSQGDRLPSGLFRKDQIDQLQALFMALHQQPQSIQGYGASNLLNVAIALDLPLSKFDIRGLAIRHVDLRRAKGHQINVKQCVFEDTLLPFQLKGQLAAAMTVDGNGIAIGDETGALFYWQRDGATFRLQAVSQLPSSDEAIVQDPGSSGSENRPMPIEKILFQEPHMVIALSHQRVYSWWINDPTPPTLLTQLSAPVSCFTQRRLVDGVSYVAVGLTNGDIVFWDSMGWNQRDRTTTLIAHRTDINHLAISPDGTALVSVCSGNQGLIWDLRPHQPGPAYQEWSLGMNPCFDVGWTPDGKLWAEADPQAIRLWVRREGSPLQPLGPQSGLGLGMNHLTPDGSANTATTDGSGTVDTIRKTETFERAIAPGTLIRLRFSDNGQYLSGSSMGEQGDGLIFCWDWQTNTLQSIQQTDGYLDVLTTCEAGRLLLAAQPNQIQVFDLKQQELLWQIESQQLQSWEEDPDKSQWGESPCGEPEASDFIFTNIQDIQGLSDAETETTTAVIGAQRAGIVCIPKPTASLACSALQLSAAKKRTA